MACTCIKDITAKLREHYAGKFEKPIAGIRLQTCISFKAACGEATYSEAKITVVGQKKEKTVTIAHTFCPFCGVQLRADG